MRKTLYLLLLLFLLVGLFAACDEAEPPNTPENGENPPAHTHAFGEWTTVSAATCAAEGQEKRTCACGESETRALAVTGEHRYAEDVCSFCHKSKDQIRLADMTLKFENEYGKLYFSKKDGTIGYLNAATNQIVFTNPAKSEAVASGDYTAEEMLSQVIVDYMRDDEEYFSFNSYRDAFENKEVRFSSNASSLTVYYGMTSRRLLLPMIMEASAFEEKILGPMEKIVEENPNNSQVLNDSRRFKAFYNKVDYLKMIEEGQTDRAEAYAEVYPIVKEKGINIYVITAVTLRQMCQLEEYITTYCPEYTFGDLTQDHAYVNVDKQSGMAEYKTEIFTALTFTLDETGLTVDFATEYVDEEGVATALPETGILNTFNGVRVEVLPYLKLLNLEGITILCP